jgi:hypothetical protein
MPGRAVICRATAWSIRFFCCWHKPPHSVGYLRVATRTWPASPRFCYWWHGCGEFCLFYILLLVPYGHAVCMSACVFVIYNILSVRVLYQTQTMNTVCCHVYGEQGGQHAPCVHVCCMYVCVHLCMYVCMCVCMYVCIYVCMYVSVCICACMCACMCMYVVSMHACMYACLCTQVDIQSTIYLYTK